MGSCVETATLSGCAAALGLVGLVATAEEEIMIGTFLLLCFAAVHVNSFMVMDEQSCAEMEQEECGICHTIYMEECNMKMMEEMMPTKVSMCRNVTRYETKCQAVMEYKMVEEKRPICKVEMVTKDHTECENTESNNCKRVMKCSIGMKMTKKTYPSKVCEKVAIGKEESCVDMVKLKKEKHEAKYCSLHPLTVCKDTDGMECRKVAKKMCDYVQNN